MLAELSLRKNLNKIFCLKMICGPFRDHCAKIRDGFTNSMDDKKLGGTGNAEEHWIII